MSKKKKNLKFDALSNEVLVQLAKAQNKKRLYEKFPNIEHISGRLIDGKRQLTIFVNDDNIQGIPKTVGVHLNENIVSRVRTNILPVNNNLHSIFGVKIEYPPKMFREYGSFCCLVKNRNDVNFIGLLTAGHIFNSKGRQFILNGTKIYSGKIYNTIPSIGNLAFYCYTRNVSPRQGMDLALVQLDGQSILFSELKIGLSSIKKISQNNINLLINNTNAGAKECVIVKAINGINNSRIVSINEVYQSSATHSLSAIKIEKVTKDNDSGGAVFLAKTDELIGMVIGADDNYSYVLPIWSISNFLNNHNYLV